MSYGIGQWGEDVHFLKSNLKSLKSNVLPAAPGTMISFSYMRCPSSVTWAIQDFLQCLSGSLRPGKGQWGLGGDGGVELHPPKPTRPPRHRLTATVPESSLHRALASPARHAVPRGTVKGDLAV